MDEEMRKQKEWVDEMLKIGGVWKDLHHTLHRREIYTCGNCGHEEGSYKPFQKGTKYEASMGGVLGEVCEVARLICPECGNELDYHG